MKRAIQRLVQDPLAHKLINGEFAEGDAVLVDAKEGAGELEFQAGAGEPEAVEGPTLACVPGPHAESSSSG